MVSLGDVIKTARKTAGLTQEALAKKITIFESDGRSHPAHRSTIAQLERDGTGSEYSTIEQLAAALGESGPQIMDLWCEKSVPRQVWLEMKRLRAVIDQLPKRGPIDWKVALRLALGERADADAVIRFNEDLIGKPSLTLFEKAEQWYLVRRELKETRPSMGPEAPRGTAEETKKKKAE